MKSKIISIKEDYKLLLSSLPSMVTAMFILSVVLMNIAANRIIFQVGNVAADGGLLLSFIPFLCMDAVVKRYGAKAAIMLNLLGAAVNIFCVILFTLIAICPGNGEDFSAFDTVFKSVWFITLGSMVAYIVSGIVNSLLNSAVGQLFKKNPDGKLAFFTRSYVSTFIGQWVDNFIFAFIVYFICAPKFWGWGLPFATCIGSAFVGSILELLMEVFFSPIGYKMVKKWDEREVGIEWLDKYPLK